MLPVSVRMRIYICTVPGSYATAGKEFAAAKPGRQCCNRFPAGTEPREQQFPISERLEKQGSSCPLTVHGNDRFQQQRMRFHSFSLPVRRVS
jgi:hypothetical protein